MSLDGGAPAVVVRDDPAGVVAGGRSMRERYGIRGEEYLLCPDIYPPTEDKENFSHPLNMGRASNFGGSFAAELKLCIPARWTAPLARRFGAPHLQGTSLATQIFYPKTKTTQIFFELYFMVPPFKLEFKLI